MKKMVFVSIFLAIGSQLFASGIKYADEHASTTGLRIGENVNIIIDGLNFNPTDPNLIQLSLDKNTNLIVFSNFEIPANNSIKASVFIAPDRNLIGTYTITVRHGSNQDSVAFNVGGCLAERGEDISQTFYGQSSADLIINCTNIDKVKIANYGIFSPNFVRTNVTANISYINNNILFPVLINQVVIPLINGNIGVSFSCNVAGTGNYFNSLRTTEPQTINIGPISILPRDYIVDIMPFELFAIKLNDKNRANIFILKLKELNPLHTASDNFIITSSPNIFDGQDLQLNMARDTNRSFSITINLIIDPPEGYINITLTSTRDNRVKYSGKLKVIKKLNASILNPQKFLDPYNENRFKIVYDQCSTALTPKFDTDNAEDHKNDINNYYIIETTSLKSSNYEIDCIIKPKNSNIFGDRNFYNIFTNKYKINLFSGNQFISAVNNNIEFKEGKNSKIRISSLIDIKYGTSTIGSSGRAYSKDSLCLIFKNSTLNVSDGKQVIKINSIIEDKTEEYKADFAINITIFPIINFVEITEPGGKSLHDISTPYDLQAKLLEKTDKKLNKRNALITISSIELMDSDSSDKIWTDIEFRIKSSDGYPILFLPPSLLVWAPWPQEKILNPDDTDLIKDNKQVFTNNINSLQMAPVNFGFGWHWNPRRPSDGQILPFSFTAFAGVFNLAGNKTDLPFNTADDSATQEKIDFIQRWDISIVGFCEVNISINGKKLPLQAGMGIRLFPRQNENLNYHRNARIYFIFNLDFIKFVGSLLQIAELK